MPGYIQKHAGHFLTTFLLLVFCPSSQAGRIASIIIDDLGNNYEHGQTIINFPAAITLAILPQTQFASRLATQAHHNNKEVMLHLPLQSVEYHKSSPGTLKLHMTHKQFKQHLKENIASVPYISGINSHMGSLLTQHPGHMDWLMAEVSNLENLYFIDSLTSNKSVISEAANNHQVPNLTRDVFLDPDFKPETIRKQFDRFIEITKKKGYAIAIAHPHPTTLSFLKQNLKKLAENGIEIVPVSKLLELRGNESHVTCTGTTCSGL
ncbi:MAG: divergent polysaccharide deacetylase family protein [Gammaproteobacteria bacterium]|nr:divergent polysaccharide deacetylase family protein [Gammaproteobacteria bacterium]MDH5389322.1 divergent polysaccharide deacetylase family protein [Gammaproteobacteria bacterium]